MLGEERTKAIAFVASDMWRAFLGVVQARCSVVLHVLDRFHVAKLLGEAVDTVRRDEVRALRATGRHPLLTKTRWLLLKRPKNLRRGERGRLRELVRINLRSVRAYLLKEQFPTSGPTPRSPAPAASSTAGPPWPCGPASPPFAKFARTLRSHRRELLNWFLARGEFAAGATEGFNNKARVTTRKAYGFRSPRHAEESPCIMRLVPYPSRLGSPTDSAEEAAMLLQPTGWHNPRAWPVPATTSRLALSRFPLAPPA